MGIQLNSPAVRRHLPMLILAAYLLLSAVSAVIGVVVGVGWIEAAIPLMIMLLTYPQPARSG